MKKTLRFIVDILEIVLGVAALSFVILKFLLFPCVVDGRSMNPTLQDGDRGYSFIITKIIGIKRFDIVVINVGSDGEDKNIVKRVIGLPNDTIEYKDNQLYINDVFVKEEYLGDVHTEDFIVTLAEDEYYCLGDNRDISKDSRYYGPFSSDQIISTNMFIISPKEDFGVKK